MIGNEHIFHGGLYTVDCSDATDGIVESAAVR